MSGFVVYIKRHLSLSSFCESRQRQPSIATHRRDYEDCKQILKLSLDLAHTLKRPARLQPASRQKTCPMGRAVSEDCHSASVPLRYTPSERQSSSIHNSLRSIKQTAAWRLSPFSPGKFCELRDFAYGQNLYGPYAKFPPPKAKRLHYQIPAPAIGQSWKIDREH